MSLLIGPNGFHDGEAPDEDSYHEDGEDALNRLCDNPAYLVVGTDDDLIDNLPGWVDEVLSEHEALAEQAEKIGLEPSLYVTVPDRECNRELSDFLEELGFNVGSSYIERGPGSSVDGLVYVRNSKIPSLQKRADRELRKARKAVIRDGRKALKPGRVPADGLEAELDRLVAQSQLDDPEYREKLIKLNELEEYVESLVEDSKERRTELMSWKNRAEAAEQRAAQESGRIAYAIDGSLQQSDRYATWTWAVAAEFGIQIQGPLLKLPDGRAFAIKGIYEKKLADHCPAIVAAIDAREPGVQWLQVESRIRRGMSSEAPLRWHEGVEWFRRRLSWSQVWWTVFGFPHLRLMGTLYYKGCLRSPTGSANPANLPKDELGFSPEQQARWDQLFLEYWTVGSK